MSRQAHDSSVLGVGVRLRGGHYIELSAYEMNILILVSTILQLNDISQSTEDVKI